MIKKILSLTVIIVWILSVSNISFAQTAFYEGKTIRIIVGFSAAGGYDALARMLSRHMGKYIPGRPTIIVENMTGAGSLLAANHIYKLAKPDGLASPQLIRPLAETRHSKLTAQNWIWESRSLRFGRRRVGVRLRLTRSLSLPFEDLRAVSQFERSNHRI